jgi:hypothetical protein
VRPAAVVLCAALATLVVPAAGTLSAQSAADSTAPSAGAAPAATGGHLPLPFRGGPWVTGTNVWAGSAFSIRTASNNEKFAGASMQLTGVQFTRSLFARKGVQFSWIVEVLPFMLARVGAPVNRLPTASYNAAAYTDKRRFARYTLHDAYGFGVAPFGAEMARPIVSRLSGVFNVTAGGAFFSAVVPYGKATQANFTASPTLALEWRLNSRYAISSGYNLHHLSNASFGAANPGLNSHLVFVRLAKAREFRR